jgi:hypothetical protein
MHSIADNELADTGIHVGAIAGAQRAKDVPGIGTINTILADNFFNQDKNPGVGQVGSNALLPGDLTDAAVITGGGGLTTDQLADSGVRDAILNGGDVAGAIDHFTTAQQSPANPPASTPPTSVSPPPSDPIAQTPPPNDGGAVPSTPPQTPALPTDPVAPGPDIPPVSTPSIPPNVIPNTVTAQAVAAQARHTGQQMVEDMLSNAIEEQIAGFENQRVPLDQLMAHLTQGTGKTRAATPDVNHASSVNGVSIDGAHYSTEAEEQEKEEAE